MNTLRFTLRQLEYFIAVAETGSLSGAAERCNVSQAGLSVAITELERGLRLTLLTRRRAKGVSLTEAGQQLLIRAREVLDKSTQLQSHAEYSQVEISGRLKVGCYSSLAPLVIPPLMSGFRQEYPDVDLEFLECGLPEAAEQLYTATTEIALLYDWDLAPDLERIKIHDLKQHVIVSGDHPLAVSTSVSLDDLAGEGMILYDVAPSPRNGQAVMAEFGFNPDVVYRTTNFELVRCLVARGVGYSLLFQHPKVDVTYEGLRVVAIPIREPIASTSLVVAYPSATKLSRRAEAFIAYCLAALPAT